MKIEKVSIKDIKMNPNNPRIIKDDKFKKLVKSIKEFPEMLEARPIVVDNDMIILGGNMRTKACIEAGLKEVFIIKFNDLTDEKKKEFIVKDNVGYGEWDWEILQAEWNIEELDEWGLEVPTFMTEDFDLGDFFDEDTNSRKEPEYTKLVIKYSTSDYEKVVAELNKIDKDHSKALWSLLKIKEVYEEASDN
jgi:ParB-like chromosome segregation protein Spo0J